ncbi:MAG: hypothetical protein QXF26_05775 [Candidatus Bathyarchaeia archaeon]
MHEHSSRKVLARVYVDEAVWRAVRSKAILAGTSVGEYVGGVLSEALHHEESKGQRK